jgi:histidinol-phosphatase (PHP family)
MEIKMNIYRQNLHTHGILCDGKDEYESTVLRAIELGFDTIGFSGHSYTSYSKGYCMSIDGTEKYKVRVNELKKKYEGKIDVLCGVEFDMYSSDPLENYDYIIGSVHYLDVDGELVGFDRSAEEVKRVIDTCFDGNGMKYAKKYYETLCLLPEYVNSDIVGHFDIITKHIEKTDYFDTDSKEYRSYALEALHTLAEKCRVFEVNTGAIARGYRTTPYPQPFILKEMSELGCGVVISSDCHNNRYLDYHFTEAIDLLRSCGFNEVLSLEKDGFRAHKI